MIDGTEIEEDAEYWAQALLNQYIINKKSKTMRIDGVGDIWERKDIRRTKKCGIANEQGKDSRMRQQS